MSSDRTNEVKSLLLKNERAQQAHEKAIAESERSNDEKYEKLLREYQGHRERTGKQMSEQVYSSILCYSFALVNVVPIYVSVSVGV
jgi:hypothetical protein